MKRLTFFALMTFFISNAWALQVVPYNEKAVAKEMSSGSPIVFHFYAEWCMICQQQKFMVNELKNNDKFSKLTVYLVDFDFEKALKEKYKVERQSTFIVIRDGVEISRALGIKDKDKIADLFKLGL